MIADVQNCTLDVREAASSFGTTKRADLFREKMKQGQVKEVASGLVDESFELAMP